MAETLSEPVSEAWGVWIQGIEQWMNNDNGVPYVLRTPDGASLLAVECQSEFSSKLEARAMAKGDEGANRQVRARYAIAIHAGFGEGSEDVPDDLVAAFVNGHTGALTIPFEAAVRISVSPHLAVALFAVDNKAAIDRVASDAKHLTRGAIALRMFAGASEGAKLDYVSRAKAIADAYVEQAE